MLDEIILSGPENGDWLIGMMPVITNLRKGKVVYALVTALKNGNGAVVNSYVRLIQEPFPLTGRIALKKTCSYGVEDIFYLPLAQYGLRWNIQVSYYGGKTFWSWRKTGSAVREANGW